MNPSDKLRLQAGTVIAKVKAVDILSAPPFETLITLSLTKIPNYLVELYLQSVKKGNYQQQWLNK